MRYPLDMTYKLEDQEWEDLGPLPGADKGGFGAVKLVKDSSGVPAVAKLIKKDDLAYREILLVEHAKLQNVRNVVEILDKGEHADDSGKGPWYVIVTPLADKSLSQHLREAGGRLSTEQAIRVLRDVATSMEDIHAKVAIHRDIKPANILKYGEEWRLADFGLARAISEATGTETWKGGGSWPYMAPEIFLNKTPTGATDVYSFGVMAFEILEGYLPFPGPTFGDAHLTEAPPLMSIESPQLEAMVIECLAKEPKTRPTPIQIQKRLLSASDDRAAAGSLALAEVGVVLAREEATEQARAARAEAEEATTLAHLAKAHKEYMSIIDSTIAEVASAVPRAEVTRNVNRGSIDLSIELGTGALQFANLSRTYEEWPGQFPVLAFATVSAQTYENGNSITFASSHSLWYCDPGLTGAFGWHEIAFDSDLTSVSPCSISPHDFGFRISPSSALVDTTSMREIDYVAPGAFLQDWLLLFANAARGALNGTTHLRANKVEPIEMTESF